MPSSAAAGYHDVLEGKLIAAVATSTTTGVTVKVKQINGATPTWPTVAHRLKVIQKTAINNKAEIWAVAAGTSQSGQTVTLGTLTRALSLSDGTNFTGSAGTAQSFAAGGDVFLAWDVHDASMTPKLDIANTFTGTNTFTGAVVSSGSQKVPVYADATARDAAITVPANGMEVYLTAEGKFTDYVAGAWTDRASGTNPNASTTVAGKVEEGTVAEQGTATAAGATGARLFPAVANLVKTSSGAGDENKLAILNASGQWADGYLGTGTASSSNFLRGDRTWTAAPSELFGTGASGVPTWTSGASLNPAGEFNYTTATLPVSQTLTVSTVNVPLIIHNTGDVTINGTVDLNGKGGAAGAGTVGAGNGGNGTAGASLVSGWTNGLGTGGTSSAGGGAGAGFDADGTAPGTGGTEGVSGTKIDPERVAFLASFMRAVICGGGGGGGGANTSGGAGNGGAGGEGGGALVWLIGGNLTLGAASIVRANGVAGTAGSGTAPASGQSAGGGGGGGGGMIFIIVAGAITNSGVTITATAGALGAGQTNNAPDATIQGGAGGAGKAIIYSLSTGTLITA